MRKVSILLVISILFLLFITPTSHSENTPKRIVYDNGLTVLLKRIPSTGIASINVIVRAGSVHEGDKSGSGIAHLAEHMIFKGTPRRRPGEIEKVIRSLGGTINGGTTFDYASYVITIPKENLSLALEVLSDALFYASIHPKELERERKVILKEIRLNNDDPARNISRLLWELVFRKHPYQHPIIGYESTFLKLTREDVLKFYKDKYVPNRMVLSIAGDIEYDKILMEIEPYFKEIERSHSKEVPLVRERQQVSKRVFEKEKDLELSYFALGYRGCAVENKDMPALDILAVLLGQGRSSRLNSSLYIKKNLVYSIGSWNYTPLDPGIFIISGVTSPEKLNLALSSISEEVDTLKEHGITDEELKKAKAMVSADYVYSLESPAEQAREMAINETLISDFDYTKKYLDKIDALTLDDILEVANSYLSDDTLSIVSLGPNGEERPLQDDTVNQREIKRIDLDNGIRVLLLEDHSLPKVSIVAGCLGGLMAEEESNAGISNLVGTTMIKGTSSMSEKDISDRIEGMGAALAYFSGNNSIGLRCELLSKDLSDGLDLIADILLNPSFNDAVVEREQNTILASIEAIDDDIFSSGMRLLKEALFLKHPYRFQTIGNIGSIQNLKRDDLKRFHDRYFIPKNMVIAVFGDIDKVEIEKDLARRFSGHKEADTPSFTDIKEPVSTEPRYASKGLNKEQSLVMLGFKGTTVESRDRYTLQLISAALSGISGRLSNTLRGKRGLAYTLGSFSMPAVDPGYFVLYVSTTKKNIETVKKELLGQIHGINRRGLSREELDSAKRELIGNQRIALQTNSALAHHTLLDELYGLGFNHFLEYADLINPITNHDIVDAARRYLGPKTCTLVVVEGH